MTTGTLKIKVKLKGYTLTQAHRMLEDAYAHLEHTGMLGRERGLSVPFEDHKRVALDHQITVSEK